MRFKAESKQRQLPASHILITFSKYSVVSLFCFLQLHVKTINDSEIKRKKKRATINLKAATSPCMLLGNTPGAHSIELYDSTSQESHLPSL